MRIRNTKTELEEAGLDTEGMADSTAALREELIALSGVDILESDGATFKSTFDILDELSARWQDLGDLERSGITRLVAGVRQGNMMEALMSNYDIARETLKTAMYESEGSAEAELENWNKGLEASIAHLQASFQKLSMDVIGSDFAKGIVDFGTGTINVIDAMTKSFGTLNTVIGTGVALKGLKSIA